MCGTLFDEGSLCGPGGCPSKELKQLFRGTNSHLRRVLRTLSVEDGSKGTTQCGRWGRGDHSLGCCDPGIRPMHTRFGRDQVKGFVTLCIWKGRAQSPGMSNSGSSVNPFLGIPVVLMRQTFTCWQVVPSSSQISLESLPGIRRDTPFYLADKHRVLSLTDIPFSTGRDTQNWVVGLKFKVNIIHLNAIFFFVLLEPISQPLPKNY